MAILPRYQRIGVRARQPEQIDFAAAREQARLGQTISRQFERMADFAFERAAEQAEERGRERVREEGARNVLASLREAGGPKKISEKAAYEAANRVAVAQIQTEAEVEITKVMEQAELNKIPYSQLQAQLADLRDGFSSAMADVDPVAAELLETRLEGTIGKSAARYSSWITQQNIAAAKQRQNTAAGTKGTLIIQNSIIDGATPETIGRDLMVAANELIEMGVPAENVEAWRQNIYSQAIQENYLKRFHTSDLGTQTSMVETLKTQPLPGLSLKETQSFRKSLNADLNASRSAIQAQSKLVTDGVTEQQDILDSGGRPSQQTIADLTASAAEVAQYDGGVAANAVNQLIEDATIAQAYRKSTPIEMEREVIDLRNGIEGEGGEGIDTTAEVRRLERAEKFLTSMKTQIDEDPLGYAQRVGLIDYSPLPFDNPETLEAAFNQRIKDATRVATHYQIEPRFLFANEARTLSAALDSAEAPVALAALATVTKFDKQAGQVLTELAQHNPGKSLVGGLVLSGNTEAARMALAGMDRLKAGYKPVGMSNQEITAQVVNQFGTSIAQTPKLQSSIVEVASAIYAEKAALAGADQFDQSLFRDALQMAAGQTVVNGEVKGGTQEVRDMQTFILPQYTADDYGAALDRVTVQALENVTGQQIDESLVPKINEDDQYKLRYVGGSSYMIEANELGSPDYRVIGDKDGNPVVFDINQLLTEIIPSPSAAMVIEQPEAPTGAEGAPVGEFTGAQEAVAPTVPGEQARTIEPGQEMRKRGRSAEQTIRQQVEIGRIAPSAGETALPLLRTVPDSASDEEYINYMDAVFGGFRKPYKDWKASQ